MWANPSVELLSSHLTICIVEMGKTETRWPGWWSVLHRVPVDTPALTPTWHWTCRGVEGTQGVRQASGPVPAPTLESQEGFSLGGLPNFCIFSDSKVSCVFANTSRWAHRAAQTGFPIQVLQPSQKQEVLLHRTRSLRRPGQGAGRQRELPTHSSCREGETQL